MRYLKFEVGQTCRANLYSEFDLVVASFEAEGGSCQLQLRMTVREGFRRISVDWGDGISCECEPGLIAHDYSAGGPYRVRIGPEAKWWRVYEGYHIKNGRMVSYARPAIFPRSWSDTLESCNGAFAGWNDTRTHGVQGPIIPWGRSLRSTSCCYELCNYVTGPVPEWPKNVTDVTTTYDGCAGLTGCIPKWGRGIVKTSYCYHGCTGLSGRIPSWPDGAVEVASTYSDCTGLVGPIPPWPSAAATLRSVYSGCAALDGIIPAWPPLVAETYGCYENCVSLSGVWTRDPALLMPEDRIFTGSTYDSYKVECTVRGCSESIRSLFYERWGGLIPNPA